MMSGLPYADAMTKSDAKKFAKDNLEYYLPGKKATKIRKEIESSSMMQCFFGIDANPQTHTVTNAERKMDGLFMSKDKLISINGVNIDWNIEHPRKHWGSIEKTAIEKGDDVFFSVIREGKKVILTSQCYTDRRKVVEMYEDAAVAFLKYEGKIFLDKWGHLSDDAKFTSLIHQVALISLAKREIRKTDYNSYYFNMVLLHLDRMKNNHESGYEIDLKVVKNQIEAGVDYLFQNHSAKMASTLEDAMNKFLTNQFTSNALEENKILAKNVSIKPSVEKTEAVEEIIDSAFGLKLGSIFTQTKVKIGSNSGGSPLYRFTPQNPVSFLKNYAVILTPKSDQIVEIWAWNKLSDSFKCKEKLKQIEAGLDRKYLSIKNKSTSERKVEYSSDKRTIIAICRIMYDRYSLNLYYKDNIQEVLRINEKNNSENLEGL